MEVSSVSHRIIADLLHARTGQQLSESRRWRIGTALAGLFRERGISNLDQLVCLLADPGEKDLAGQVVEALLNNETYFFRDRQMYDILQSCVLPELHRSRGDRKRLSIWSAGCSTGQEALSMAMMFADDQARWKDWHIQILGTDISGQAVKAANAGVYSQFEIQRGLGIAHMLDHFEEASGGWAVKDSLKRMVRYREHNVLDAPPNGPASFDLVLCRNVLLYFDRSKRELAFDRLRSAIAEDGWLMLGAGESATGHTENFVGSQLNSCLHRPVAGPVRSPFSGVMASGA